MLKLNNIILLFLLFLLFLLLLRYHLQKGVSITSHRIVPLHSCHPKHRKQICNGSCSLSSARWGDEICHVMRRQVLGGNVMSSKLHLKNKKKNDYKRSIIRIPNFITNKECKRLIN